MNNLVIVIREGVVIDVLVDGDYGKWTEPEYVVVDYDLSNSTQATEIPWDDSYPIEWKGKACVSLGTTECKPEFVEYMHRYANELENE